MTALCGLQSSMNLEGRKGRSPAAWEHFQQRANQCLSTKNLRKLCPAQVMGTRSRLSVNPCTSAGSTGAHLLNL